MATNTKKTTTPAPKTAVTAPKTTATPAKTTTAPPKTVTPVPETVLKKRRSKEERQVDDKQKKVELRKKRRQTRQLIFKRAENYVKEYRQKEREVIRLRRQARSAGNFFVEPEAKVALVIRIRGINQLHPKPRKILQLLRLRQIHNAVFVRLTKATWNMLKLIEPYVAYGYPNLKTVKEMVYKRGFGKVDKNRIPITDNSIIEQNLGKHGILCLEDVVHELYTVGPHFSEVSRFLWPFKLSCPRGGYRKITTHYIEGGDFGNREDKINSLVRRMN